MRRLLQQVELLRSRSHVLCPRSDLRRSGDGELLRPGTRHVLRSRADLLQVELLQAEVLQEPLPQEPLPQELLPEELLRPGPKLLRSGCADLRRSGRADLRRSSRCVLQLVDPVDFRVPVSFETGTRMSGVQPARRGFL
jgi:hypothetical protein